MRGYLLPLIVLLLGPLQSIAAQPVWPPPPAAARIRFIEAFSGPEDIGLRKRGLLPFLRRLFFGSERAAFVRPYGIAVSADGQRIAVTDPGLGAVLLFDRRAGSFHLLRGDRPDALRSPIGVAMDGAGRLFVADSEAGRVLAFDARRRLLFSLGRAEGAGKALQRPTGLAVHSDRLYVTDTLAHRVLAYRLGERGAQLLFVFGSRGIDPGAFNYPVDLTISGGGELYVNDTMNFRVQVFDLQGRLLRAQGHPGDSSGSFQRSKGIATDSDGNLYVVDALFDAVQVFDPASRFMLHFGQPGRGRGEFWLPAGMAVDRSDRIYVVDSANARVQVFQYLKEASGAKP